MNSVNIRNNGNWITIVCKGSSRLRYKAPYRGISFINTLCVLRRAFGISFTFRYEYGSCQGERCIRYITVVDGIELCVCNLGTWAEQEVLAVQALQACMSRLKITGEPAEWVT